MLLKINPVFIGALPYKIKESWWYDLEFVLSEIPADVFAVDYDVLDERFFELDGVRKLFADKSSDCLQEQQRTEREDAEAERRQQDVEKL